MDYTTENKSKSSDIMVPLALILVSGPGGDPSWICLDKYKRDITKLNDFLYLYFTYSAKFLSCLLTSELAPVVQNVDNAVHWINHYSLDSS